MDELIERTELPYAQTVEALTELEILGHIQLEPGGKYTLVLRDTKRSRVLRIFFVSTPIREG